MKHHSTEESSRVYASFDELVELQYQGRKISLLPRQPVSSLLSGRHASRLRGRGLSFEELRAYRPGDDIRTMDWRATARLKKPQVRVYSEERERPVILAVDMRSNMLFGSRHSSKARAGAKLAALAAWATLAGGDRVGAVIFGDDEKVEIKPQRSRANVLRICHELVRMNKKLSSEAQSDTAPSSQLNTALRRASRLAKHDHLLILITDYEGDDEETRRIATKLASHNDVLAALVYDPLGIQLPRGPQMEVSDGTQRVTIPDETTFHQRFQLAFESRIAELKNNLKAIKIPILPICTHDSVTEQVMKALGRRV